MSPLDDGRGNHGVVLFHGQGDVDIRIWRQARDRGHRIAVYAERRLEQSSDERATRLWSQASTVEDGEPSSLFHTSLLGERVEYVRYEPKSEGRFAEMCGACSGYKGSPAVALSEAARDEDAMRLLNDMQSQEVRAMSRLHEEFYVPHRRNLRREGPSGTRLSSILGTIRLSDTWSYFMGFFAAKDGAVVFLCSDESLVQGLFPPSDGALSPGTRADWLHDYGVIDKW